MKNRNIIYNNSIPKKYLSEKLNKRLKKNFNNIFTDITKNINSQNNVFSTLNKNFNYNFKIKEINKFKKFKNVVVIGMGGSSLGSEAIYNFLGHKINRNFTFLNNIDDTKIKEIFIKKKTTKILFIVISKSGNTIETLSNLIALRIIKNNSRNIMVISERNNNALYLLAKKKNFYFVEHKKFIGGRYSVLSEVGIIPSILMGLNITKLKQDSLKIFKSKNKKFLKESSLNLTNLMNKRQFNNLVLLNYVPQLDKFLFWAQQLIAESLGKKGRGFLPIISPAPKDHHSLLQLYLDGKKDKIFYIFSQDKNRNKKIKLKSQENILNFYKYKNLNQIKEAQTNAIIKSFKNKQIPFREFKIKAINEQTLGELFSYFMVETVITGRLANINPFDQPAVEKVKEDTKKLLS